MRILIPSVSFYPAQEGGPSNALYWLAKGFVKEGIDVSVVTTGRYIKDNKVILDRWHCFEGIRIIYQSVKHYKFSIRLLRTNLKEVRNCDVVISNGLCYLPGFVLNTYALFKNKKVIISPRGEMFSTAIANKGFGSKILKTCYFKFINLIYNKKVIYHATSVEERDSIIKMFGKNRKVVIIPNYMVLPRHIHLSSNPYSGYLLYVGRIAPIKALDNLIRGLSKSKKFMESSLQLLLAGEIAGDYYKYLQTVIADNQMQHKVKFLGLVTGEAKNELYAKAKCLYLVSKSENFGNVVIEALAQGTPVITSKGTPWASLASDGCGWWIDNEPASIAKATDELLDMEEIAYNCMRQRCYDRCINDYDIYNNIDDWINLIK